MQGHGQHPVGAGAGDQVGHQLGRDGIAGLGLAVLTGIAKVGDDGGDAAGGGAAQRVDHNEQFHQGVVYGVHLSVLLKGAGGLHHKDVRPADGLVDGGKVFAVGEGAYLRIAQGYPEFLADGLGQVGVRVARENLDALPVCDHNQLPSVFRGAARGPCSVFLYLLL